MLFAVVLAPLLLEGASAARAPNGGARLGSTLCAP